MVTGVEAGTAAAGAGVLVGDELLSLCGVDVSGRGADGMREAMRAVAQAEATAETEKQPVGAASAVAGVEWVFRRAVSPQPIPTTT